MKIFIDTREKRPWTFDWYDCETEVAKLHCGDYTAEGIEEKLVIERKASTGELLNNLCTKVGYQRFRNEMEKLQIFDVEHIYLLCEFPQFHMDVFPEQSGIPKSRWPKVTAKFLKKRMHDIVKDFNIRLIYCDTKENAEEVAFNILKRAHDEFRESTQL